jgi:hypothetical protein
MSTNAPTAATFKTLTVVDDRIERLLSQIETSTWIKECAPGVTAQQVRAIIQFGHVHGEKAYPGFPVNSKIYTVVTPDHQVHHVQVTVDKPGSDKNHLCCITCYNPTERRHCAAAVAAFIVEIVKETPKMKREKETCPACGEILN